MEISFSTCGARRWKQRPLSLFLNLGVLDFSLERLISHLTLQKSLIEVLCKRKPWESNYRYSKSLYLVFPRITGKVTPGHFHFVKVLMPTQFYTFDWKRYSHWETNNCYVLINPLPHCYSFLGWTTMKAVLNAIKLQASDFYSRDFQILCQ